VNSLKDRVLADVKASPAKAIFLGVGLLAAVVVWGPRLTASLAQPAPGVVDATTASAGSDVLRDPASIRAAFIHVSDEAKLLRRYADPVDPGVVKHDPFEHEKIAAAEPEKPLEIESAAAAETPEEIATNTEAVAAAALRLSGVVIFKTGRGAVIDGQVFHIGGRIGPFTLTEVAERSAKVRGDRGTYSLVMTTEEMDK
jgi:hypothetical protein